MNFCHQHIRTFNIPLNQWAWSLALSSTFAGCCRPWITRSSQQCIPVTLIARYCKGRIWLQHHGQPETFICGTLWIWTFGQSDTFRFPWVHIIAFTLVYINGSEAFVEFIPWTGALMVDGWSMFGSDGWDLLTTWQRQLHEAPMPSARQLEVGSQGGGPFPQRGANAKGQRITAWWGRFAEHFQHNDHHRHPVGECSSIMRLVPILGDICWFALVISSRSSIMQYSSSFIIYLIKYCKLLLSPHGVSQPFVSHHQPV